MTAYQKGWRYRVIRAGCSLHGWTSTGAYSMRGASIQLAVDDVITCQGTSMTSGDGMPVVKWRGPKGERLIDSEFHPSKFLQPADGCLELVSPLTLEQFRATRREVADLREAIDGTFDEPRAGYVYTYDGASFYIEKENDGRLYLIIGRDDWLTEADQIGELEAHLYEFAHGECQPRPERT